MSKFHLVTYVSGGLHSVLTWKEVFVSCEYGEVKPYLQESSALSSEKVNVLTRPLLLCFLLLFVRHLSNNHL